jgi:hypothetical protein
VLNGMDGIQDSDTPFTDFVKLANGSATKLVDLIISKFPGFRDESIYNIKVILYSIIIIG